jgi:UDP-glucose 4-epimerase
VERSLVEVESYIRDFAEDNPHVSVSLLRFANVLGTDIVTPLTKALDLPVVPSLFGFDPLLQFVEEDDVVRSIEFVMRNGLHGAFNVAGDGRLPWSEVTAICGKRTVPLPAVATGLAVAPLSRLGLLDLPPETVALLRYGRGVDNRRLKKAGFSYRYTSAGAVESYARASRLRRVVGNSRPVYTYDADVEQFLRRSPAVVRRDT